MSFRLIEKDGPDAGRVHDVKDRSARIGRIDDNEVVIASEYISRHHAEITFDGMDYVIEDLGSKNGTIVNGELIAAPCKLRSGDQITFPGVTLSFTADEETVTFPAPAPTGQPTSTPPRGATTGRPLTGVRAILFTDLVGHTEIIQRLGDEPGRDFLREHERIVRKVLAENAGDEVKTLGDGFMASFESVTAATRCAIGLQRAFAEHNTSADEPILVRVGLNAGEPIEEEGDYFGSSVILASRLADHAEPGQVLASVAVHELCAGKGFDFRDAGETELKGFTDPVRYFEVIWRRDAP